MDKTSHPAQESIVYFASMRVGPRDSLIEKFSRLLNTAGLADLDLQDKYVAIKSHFGESGNVTHLKPAYTRAVAQEVRAKGGKPFVADCSTLYVGMRSDMIGHLECAAQNGFTPQSCGCQIIIADGLRGTDEVAVPVPNGEYLSEALIGRAFMDADIIVTVTHAKGCTASSYGGTLKNLSMGCASKAGKIAMHSKGILQVLPDQCVGCKKCLSSCGQNAIEIYKSKARINNRCVGCGHCLSFCIHNAIVSVRNDKWDDMQLKMAEYAAAVVAAKPSFHVTLAIDVTPQCDCFANSDMPIVPNVGMFASKDPVALDQAVTDAICAQPANRESALHELYEACSCKDEDRNHLQVLNPSSHWKMCIEHAEELGAGVRNYRLVKVNSKSMDG